MDPTVRRNLAEHVGGYALWSMLCTRYGTLATPFDVPPLAGANRRVQQQAPQGGLAPLEVTKG